MKRAIILVTLLSLALPLGVAHADTDLTVGSVHFHSDQLLASLGNDLISRTWWKEIRNQIRDPASGRVLAAGAPEFEVTLDGVPFSSSSFTFRDVTATPIPHGIAATFAYDLASPTTAIWIERSVSLFEDAPILQITTILHNETPLPHRVTAARFDEVGAVGSSIEVGAYVGGSDWRDDFRGTKTESFATTFNDEGETARIDDGTGHGVFMVSERRGGAASRVGSNGPMTWIGVDYPRDLIDLGPLATSPPNYNRVENPAYPAPVNGRLVAPLSTMKLGTVATGVYHGGAQNAAVEYADYLATYRQPQYKRAVALNSFHPWSHGADFNDATMRKQTDVAKQLGIDTIVLDDQWQGGPGGESGDWQWDTSSTDGDPARFPDSNHDGVADIVDYVHSQGLKLGLWMSPVEFHANSQTFKDHPNWACTPIGTATGQAPSDAGLGVWDINNQDFRAYITGVVDRLIRDDDVHYFKFDFQTWVDCPPYDYNDYEEGFASWVDALEAKHADVAFEFDETNDQRMWAFESVARGPAWFDNGHGHTLPDGSKVTGPAQLLHDIWMASPWIPPSTIGAGTFDGTLGKGYDASFLLPIACLTYWTFWTDLTKLSPVVRAETAWWIDWYHAHSDALRGGAYELTDTDPMDGTSAAAFEIGGYVFAFRQVGEAPELKLHQQGSFTLTNVRDGSVLGPFVGGDAITVPLANKNSASVYQITAV